ncbi:MAG TPA: 16S rRNA (guanine(966)-N(2))-methyltransferase RsmD [Kiritimatiellia bacterium]|nr:16S rRNA (guanine(966)-N(2))-methyltransferase RsmD [Kiritimatiellia bacterium]
MVRITGGLYRGRKLKVPRAGVRPTKDMVRQALFSALGESIVGKRVGDLFAGTGAIGLEAISRGAAEVVWVEAASHTFDILRENLSTVLGESIQPHSCVRADAMIWLKSLSPPLELDLLVADPPYEPENNMPWAERLLDLVAEGQRLKSDGLLVVEQHIDQPVIDKPVWNILKEARYGETRLVYYRRKEP